MDFSVRDSDGVRFKSLMETAVVLGMNSRYWKGIELILNLFSW